MFTINIYNAHLILTIIVCHELVLGQFKMNQTFKDLKKYIFRLSFMTCTGPQRYTTVRRPR